MGTLVMSNDSVVVYSALMNTTYEMNMASDGTMSDINIKWQIQDPIISRG